MSNPFETIDDSYNPFEETTPAPPPTPPAPQQTTYTPPPEPAPEKKPEKKANSNAPIFGNLGGGVIKDPNTGLTLSEKDLEERERALAEKEQKIADRERQIEEAKANGTYDQLNTHKRNFPKFLNWYKYYPEEDIPEDARQMVKFHEWLQYGFAILTALNFFGCICSLGTGSSVASPASSIFFSLMYMLVLVPVFLDIVFITLYNSLRDQKGLKYVGFLAAFGIQALFVLFLAIAFMDYGSIGWMVSIDILGGEKGKWVGGYGIVWSIIATAFTGLICWMWYKAFIYYRSGSLKAKSFGEAASMAANYAREHPDQVAAAAAHSQV